MARALRCGCGTHAVGLVNGKPMCWQHIDEHLEAAVKATVDAWKAAGWDPVQGAAPPPYQPPPAPVPKARPDVTKREQGEMF